MQYLSVCSLRKLLENLVTDVTDVVFVLCHVTYIVPNTIRVICHVSVLDVRHFPPAIPNSLGLILPRGFFPTMLRGLREMTMHDRKKMHIIWVSFYLEERINWGHQFLRLLVETGPPFYVVVRATRRSSRLQSKGSTFIPQLFEDLEYWFGSGNRTQDLPLCSQLLYRLSLFLPG